jgi:hypothetical protein
VIAADGGPLDSALAPVESDTVTTIAWIHRVGGWDRFYALQEFSEGDPSSACIASCGRAINRSFMRRAAKFQSPWLES